MRVWIFVKQNRLAIVWGIGFCLGLDSVGCVKYIDATVMTDTTIADSKWENMMISDDNKVHKFKTIHDSNIV